MDFIGVVAIVLSFVSIGVALWQGFLSRRQLRLAEDTEARTERALEEIRQTSGETRLIADDIKANLLNQINRVLETKLQGETSNQQMGAEMMRSLMQNMQRKSGTEA